VRDVTRRGYTVLNTVNFQQYANGWRLDLGVRDPHGQATTGICLVAGRSGQVSLQGLPAQTGGGGDGFAFDCSSVDGKYRECQLPLDGAARLVKRFSHAPCDEGRTWGQRGDRSGSPMAAGHGSRPCAAGHRRSGDARIEDLRRQ
jgi:hypothetical protein